MEDQGITQAEAGSTDEGGPLTACLLLFLQAAERDGEDLRELAQAFGFHRRAGTLADTLDRLEADHLVRSASPEDTGGEGRVYGLTPGGHQWLAMRAESLREAARLVARFLDRYVTSAASQPPTSMSDAEAR